MKISQIILYLIIVVVISCNSCKTKINSPIDEINGIWPLEVGNTWINRTSVYLKIPGVDSNAYLWDTITVLRDSIIDNERWFAVRFAPESPNKLSGYDYFIDRTDGVYSYLMAQYSGVSLIPHIEYLIKYPSEIGDSVLNGGTVSKLVSTTDTASVNGNIYSCYTYLKYIYDNNMRDTTQIYWMEYMSPEVGTIKTDEYSRYGELIFETNLVSYKLN